MRTDLDSHADAPCVGSNALVIYETMRTANVTSFINSIGRANEVPIVHAALAYDCLYTGTVYILIVNHALQFPEMGHNLINQFQMRASGIIVNACPKFQCESPTNESHTLYFPEDDVRLPLSVHGAVSFLHTRKPTRYEYENEQQLTLTAETPEWDPHSLDFADQEERMTDDYGQIREIRHDRRARTICAMGISAVRTENTRRECSQSACVLGEISNTLNDDTFIQGLNRHVNVSVTMLEVAATVSKPKNVISPERLAKTWGIGIEAAKRTTQSTTQRGVRSVLHPSLTKGDSGQTIGN
jgi:hypothetical protein